MATKNQSIRERSVDTQLLLERLIKAKEDEVITYDELSSVIGRDVQKQARSKLASACHAALSEHQMLFECVRNVGMKRCSDKTKIAAGMSHMERARRQVKRGIRKLTSIDSYEKLTKEEQVNHNAYLSLYGTIYEIGKPKKLEQLKAKVEEAQAKLPLAKTLELFQR